MIFSLRACLLLFIGWLFPLTLIAQTIAPITDSVVVTGRIRNLSARLYRDQPTVLVSRTNILQASRELVRAAPLAVDGTFRVALPLIYPQEELYFNYGRIATAFLAAPGTLSIELDADSLFTAAVPFRFGGVNAQVNNQFARYKAFEAALTDKPDNRKLSGQVEGKSAPETFRLLLATYQAPFRQFAARQTVFPLVSRWIGSINRYNAAGFLYDKAVYESGKIGVTLDDSLRPPGDRLLTAARASAMNRFAEYAQQQRSVANQTSAGLSVPIFASLLLRYGQNLTDEEQTRLRGFISENTAKSSDLRFFDRLVKRSNDTLQRLVNFETIIQRSRVYFPDVADIDYIIAHTLASNMSGLTLDFTKLLYSYARPQVKDAALGHSLDELYRLEVKDSTRLRAAVLAIQKAGETATAAEISSGVLVSRDATADGMALFNRIVASNRGKVIYVLLTSANEDADRQAALDAQRLRSLYRPRDFALVYVPMVGSDPKLWAEFATKYNLTGDHLLLTASQVSDILPQLRPDETLSGTVINRTGKIVKRNAPMPGALEEVRKVIEKSF